MRIEDYDRIEGRRSALSITRRLLICASMILAVLAVAGAERWVPRFSGAVFICALWCEFAGVLILLR